MSKRSATAATLPWQDWPQAQVVEADSVELEVLEVNEAHLGLAVRSFSGGERSVVGQLTYPALQQLATHAGFPVDFIQKLPMDLQCEVVNDRLLAAPLRALGLAALEDPGAWEGRRVTELFPAGRAGLPHQEVCQVTYDRLREVLGEDVEVRVANLGPEGLDLRLLTYRQQSVTSRVGDILRAGLRVRHRMGVDLGLGLFVERLVCTNGMTRTAHPFDWSRRSENDRDGQLRFIREQVPTIMESYGDLVARAQAMAERRVQGSPLEALRERLQALRVPRRHWDAIAREFQEEPGDTEWHLTQALTRYATHRAGWDDSRRFMEIGGEWVANYDVVTARLPRHVAQRVGAQILDEPRLADGIAQQLAETDQPA